MLLRSNARVAELIRDASQWAMASAKQPEPIKVLAPQNSSSNKPPLSSAQSDPGFPRFSGFSLLALLDKEHRNGKSINRINDYGG